MNILSSQLTKQSWARFFQGTQKSMQLQSNEYVVVPVAKGTYKDTVNAKGVSPNRQ